MGRAAGVVRASLLLLGGLFVGGHVSSCAEPERLAEPPPVDRASFESEIYPILLRDCGFPACHGNPARFLRVFGPGRTRLDAGTLPYDPPTPGEVDATFDRTRSMLSGVPEPTQSLLLRKPLEASAGGGAHQGLDALGRNVYASADDPSWRLLATWAGARLPDALDDAGREADAAVNDAGGVDTGAPDAEAPPSADAGDAAERDAARDAP